MGSDTSGDKDEGEYIDPYTWPESDIFMFLWGGAFASLWAIQAWFRQWLLPAVIVSFSVAISRVGLTPEGRWCHHEPWAGGQQRVCRSADGPAPLLRRASLGGCTGQRAIRNFSTWSLDLLAPRLSNNNPLHMEASHCLWASCHLALALWKIHSLKLTVQF